MFEDQKQPSSPPPTGGPLPPLPISGKMERGGLADVPTAPRAAPAAFDIPKSAVKPSDSATVIHVMPKEYYGIAPKTPVKKIAVPRAPKPAPPSPLPKPEKPPASPVAVKKRRVPMVLILGILFVVVIAVGGYLFLRSIRQPAPTPIVIAPQPEPEPEPEPKPRPTPSTPEPEPIRPGIDTDSDGLTDVEERTIYGSDQRNPDTDGDSFIDGNEVLHLYDPIVPGGATLEDQIRGPVTSYADSAFALTFLLPEAWGSPPATPPHEPSIVSIPIASGETFRLQAHPLSGESLEVIASRLFPNETFRRARSKRGYDLLRSTSQRIAIVAFVGEVVAIEYNIGTQRTIDYLRTFEMMINSIKPIASE